MNSYIELCEGSSFFIQLTISTILVVSVLHHFTVCLYIISCSWWKWWKNTWKTITRSVPPRWNWCSSWMPLSTCAVSAVSYASPWAMLCCLEWVAAGASHSPNWPHLCETCAHFVSTQYCYSSYLLCYHTAGFFYMFSILLCAAILFLKHIQVFVLMSHFTYTCLFSLIFSMLYKLVLEFF